ncbi:MAG: hypothetical protein HY690_07185 [Chloroflexi bacterium]|nr:hypothetical protein [Chloroflexota bacterium]
MDDYIIWNEPNEVGGAPLDAEHFAALLRQCWLNLTDVPRIYWGGVIFGPGVGDQPDQNSLDYIRGVYQALYDRGLAGGEYGAWPWTGINIHIHRDRTEAHIQNLFDAVNEIRSDWGESGDLLVGEWGVTAQDYNSDPNSLSHVFNLIKPHPSMMFLFAHHVHEQGGTWGLRNFGMIQDQFTLGAPTVLYGPYDALVGT